MTISFFFICVFQDSTNFNLIYFLLKKLKYFKKLYFLSFLLFYITQATLVTLPSLRIQKYKHINFKAAERIYFTFKHFILMQF